MSEPVVHVTYDTYNAEVAGSEIPVVLDFWAPWCGPCRSIGPILDELAQTYAGRVKVAKINVDEEPAIAGAFQVKGIPLVVAVKDRAIVEQMVGFRGRAPLEQLFQQLAAQAK